MESIGKLNVRQQDRHAFVQAARLNKCWILVRHTNVDSLKYIGKPNHIPKPIQCKAKTSNNPAFKWAGLVVDPTIKFVIPAFLSTKLAGALNCWASFMTTLNTAGWKVVTDKNDEHYGCLTYNGSYLHGDYDLKAVIPAEHMRRTLAAVETLNGVDHMRGPKFYAVQKMVNGMIGSDMIQHGSEENYSAHGHDAIDVFGPEDEVFTLLTRSDVIEWYKKHNRQVIDMQNHPQLAGKR